MEVIASFQSPSGTLIRVIRGDARECPADVAIFGKNRVLRRELESVSGRKFNILDAKFDRIYGADLIDLRDRGGSWSWAASIRYAPRRIHPYEHAGNPGSPWYRMPIVFSRVPNVLFACRWTMRCRSFVLMGLSCRYPEFHSLAVAYGVMSGVREDKYRLPDLVSIERIDLVDREDPIPFVRALRDEDGCLSRAGLPVVKLRELSGASDQGDVARRVARGDRDRFLAALALAPDVEPSAEDR